MARKNVKEEILNTARRLFNQRGYNSVSMRDIADALGISVGNLTYHYARKEDLIEATVLEMHRYYTPLPTPTSLQELNAFFTRLQNNIAENAFFFWHYTQLSQLSEAIREIQLSVMQDQYTLLVGALENLAQAGLVRGPTYEGEYLQLAQAVRILCIYWVPQSKLEEGLDTPKDFLQCVWSVLLPVLTDEGHGVYTQEIQKARTAFEAMLSGAL